MKRKVLTIVASVVGTLAIVLGVLWYVKTLPARRYEAQTTAIKRVVDRQELELKAYQYGQAILKIKQEQAKQVRPPLRPPVDPNK